MNEEQRKALDDLLTALADIEEKYQWNDYNGKRELRSRYMRAVGVFERTL